MPRLFIAIRPPQALRAALLGAMGGVPGARWQDDGQLHLTLAFLGEVDQNRGEALVDALTAVHASPFELAIAGIGHFERKGAVSALWAGVAPSEPLRLLQQSVVGACRSAGCPPDSKTFTPHVTLARMNRASAAPGTWLAEHGTLHAGPWLVEQFGLFESHLQPEGSLYEPVMQFTLRD